MRSNKKKQSKAARRRRSQRWMYIGVASLTAMCIGGIGLMALLNGEPSGNRYTYTTESDIWYVCNGDVEVAAAEMETQPAPTPLQPIIAPEMQVNVQVEPAAQEVFIPMPEPTAQPVQAPVPITITATGDCTLGTYRTKHGTSNFRRVYNKQGADYFFDNVRELFSEDDLTIVNLEGPLTRYSDKRSGRTFNFRGYPEYVEILQSGSVEICNMANNHALDYKEKGFKDTYQNLMDAGIGASGYGPEYFTEVNGFTVGSLGFTEWNFEVEDILNDVFLASQKCDLLIVSMHWNEEHEYKLSDYCRKMGQALIDAGADIVIGNHSHVIGEIERYKGKYIINSLGNFCFGGNDDPHVRECVIFRQTFLMHADGTVEDGGIDLIPALVSSTEEKNDFQPRIATPQEGKEILDDIAGLSETLNFGDLLWLEDSYIIRHGILTEGPQAPETPQPTDEMLIAQDVAK